MIYTEFFGWVHIDYWEFLVSFVYVVLLYLYFARRKKLHVQKEPEYKFFLWGLMAKIIGGVSCGLIYYYYYGNGDSISYFYSAVPLANLAVTAPISYLKVLFNGASLENWVLFSPKTGYPMWYVFMDDRTFMLVRLMSPVLLFTMNSFIITSVVIASLTYFGVWKCYQTFCRYYPSLMRQFAVAVLFMPSCIFWGSSIMKDTFAFTALCYWVYALDQLFFVRRKMLAPIITLLLSGFLIVALKPYIFMVLFPVSIIWIFYSRIARINNALIKYFILPFAFVLFVVILFTALNALSGSLGKFSMDNSLETIIVTQKDMTTNKDYGTNFHDVGPIEHSWLSVLSKFPKATNAALFRPYIVESRNAVSLLSGLENTWLLGLFLLVLVRTKVVGLFQVMRKNPLVLVCMAFTMIYGFVVGITTPNFGALVRFRIPLLPFFVAGMYITLFLLREKQRAKILGRGFDWRDYQRGQPDALEVRADQLRKARQR